MAGGNLGADGRGGAGVIVDESGINSHLSTSCRLTFKLFPFFNHVPILSFTALNQHNSLL
jgi:hypothetical protein